MTDVQGAAVLTVRRRGLIAFVCACLLMLGLGSARAGALVVPPGFQVKTLSVPRWTDGSATYMTGLQYPTSVDFAPDGTILVGERNGRVMLLETPQDTTPTLAVDITLDVMARGDRGILGMKLDPEYPDKPYIYLAYTHDAPIGGQSPTVADNPDGSDGCADNTPPYTDCIASGRIVQIELDPATEIAVGGAVNPPQNVLVESWCQQFMSHSIGDIEFDSSGALLAGGGDGASWEVADHGQFANACGDPEKEGGSLRTQDLRTPDSPTDPTDYNGSIIRIDRFTGEAMEDNPLVDNAAGDLPAERILTYGLRNPFRFEFRPGTDELYVGDVGWGTWEEIDRLSSPPPGSQGAPNFGWPCYEGLAPQPAWQGLASGGDAPLCKSLYEMPAGSVTDPIFKYPHGTEGQLFTGDACQPGYGASLTGLAFYDPTGVAPAWAFPESFDGTLFIADSSRGCVWAMGAGANGTPDPTQITNFATPEAGDAPFTPVDLTLGPEGALYIPNFFDSSIQRIRYFAEGQPPVARLDVDATYGELPLQVQLDGSTSSDADAGETLHYSWDTDGDGEFDDGTDTPTLNVKFTEAENVTVGLRVTDEFGNSDEAQRTIRPGDKGPPTEAKIVVDGEGWTIGDEIPFSGSAEDPDSGEVLRLDWELTMRHCPTTENECHSHPEETFPNTASGVLTAPPHEYPSHLELTLTVYDQRGLSTTITRELYPRTVSIELASDPPGIPLTLNAGTAPAPVKGVMIAGGNANVVAPATTEIQGVPYEFKSWSDGEARSHTVTSAEPVLLTATFRRVGEIDPVVTQPPPTVIPPVVNPPGAAPIHLISRPPGIRLRVDALSRRTPFDFDALVGQRVRATAPRLATVRGKQLRFRRWTNNGGRSQLVTAGEFSMLCAVYKVDVDRHRTR